MDQNLSKNTIRSGRPRDPDIEQRVVEASYRILAESGYQGLSFAKVSQLSGVARPTIKLRWHTQADLCIATVKYILDTPLDIQIPDDLTGHNVRELTTAVLAGLIRALSVPQTIRILTSVISAAHFSEPLGQLRQYILSRRGIVLRQLIEAGMQNGEFSNCTDVEFALDALNGPILYHTLILGLPMDPKQSVQIVDMVFPVRKHNAD
ncbi:MAG: TetR-like C-terminal domain-containing protein [Robiginitomaculum sp.]|nr:TetR-like C-terminal domain-containing protein [Robiginitomaculum sp.]MDQ7078435.1 TetR-like C-terminal domain-containing protein [Robiginitomaculum sp.]